jgi:hypothetical protein
MRDEGDPELANKMGRALERLTVATLRQFDAAPTVVNGLYAVRGRRKQLEVDIVVETPDRIFLFECSKKSLTTTARGGNTLDVMRDLEASFLKLLQQLARHEANLRSNGEIAFITGQALKLKDRPIEKICVSLFDHGSLQNRDLTIGLIEAAAGAQLNSGHPMANAVISLANKRLRDINTSLKTIIDVSADSVSRILTRFALSTW